MAVNIEHGVCGPLSDASISLTTPPLLAFLLPPQPHLSQECNSNGSLIQHLLFIHPDFVNYLTTVVQFPIWEVFLLIVLIGDSGVVCLLLSTHPLALVLCKKET